jgi:hypothetical protein
LLGKRFLNSGTLGLPLRVAVIGNRDPDNSFQSPILSQRPVSPFFVRPFLFSKVAGCIENIYGLAVDLGTTTIAVYFVICSAGNGIDFRRKPQCFMGMSDEPNQRGNRNHKTWHISSDGYQGVEWGLFHMPVNKHDRKTLKKRCRGKPRNDPHFRGEDPLQSALPPSAAICGGKNIHREKSDLLSALDKNSDLPLISVFGSTS